ncbi:MAG TPA: septal ring lytic transglycosylase RlpA family protein [Gaiellaceae bacterium]|nr:septal ring lytic transglycosylase RlpA family protein [Gaiellaceae bacterium]
MSIRGRALALAIVGVLALVAVVVYLVRPTHHAPSSTGTWYTALATPYAPATGTKTSACGVRIGPATEGVSHPRLPCGVRITIAFKGREVTTRVIDRGPTTPGHDFDLTRALAAALHVQGTQQIDWRFAH